MKSVCLNLLFVTAALASLSCGNNDADAPPRCETAEVGDGATVQGRLYVDSDLADSGRYDHQFDSADDDPRAGQWISLRGADGTETTGSCDDGTYAFNNLDEGVYFVDANVTDETCLLKNCPKRFGKALDEGEVVILTWGDSVPSAGDRPYFPGRLKSLLGDIAEVENRNVAEPGSQSTDWLPGGAYYENNLVPNIQDADVVLISIGGNDLVYEMQNVDITDINGAIEQAAELVVEILDNILSTVEALRALNPEVDFVYCLYVDYSLSSIGGWGLADLFLPEGTVSEILVDARSLVGADDQMLLADMFGASHTLDDALDEYMADELHFNSRGHTLYAEEIFKTLGGVLVGPSPLEGEPRTPLGDQHDFSFAP